LENYKDFLQLGFSFFVAAYLLIFTNQTLSILVRKMDEMASEIRSLREWMQLRERREEAIREEKRQQTK
jgi:dimeric dUTPase (all-alpha-NTP-PPase superfamily)